MDNKPNKPNTEDLGKDRPGTSRLQKKTPGVGVVRPIVCATDAECSTHPYDLVIKNNWVLFYTHHFLVFIWM